MELDGDEAAGLMPGAGAGEGRLGFSSILMMACKVSVGSIVMEDVLMGTG